MNGSIEWKRVFVEIPNFVQYANPTCRRNAEELLRQCRTREVKSCGLAFISMYPATIPRR